MIKVDGSGRGGSVMSPLDGALLRAVVDGADRWLRDVDLLDESPLAVRAEAGEGEECERLACRHVTGLWQLDESVDRRRLCTRDAARRLRRRDLLRHGLAGRRGLVGRGGGSR